MVDQSLIVTADHGKFVEKLRLEISPFFENIHLLAAGHQNQLLDVKYDDEGENLDVKYEDDDQKVSVSINNDVNTNQFIAQG